MRNDSDLEEDYLDWFFLKNFGKGPEFWRNLPEDKLHAIVTLEGMKQQDYWDNWTKIFKQLFK